MDSPRARRAWRRGSRAAESGNSGFRSRVEPAVTSGLGLNAGTVAGSGGGLTAAWTSGGLVVSLVMSLVVLPVVSCSVLLSASLPPSPSASGMSNAPRVVGSSPISSSLTSSPLKKLAKLLAAWVTSSSYQSGRGWAGGGGAVIVRGVGDFSVGLGRRLDEGGAGKGVEGLGGGLAGRGEVRPGVRLDGRLDGRLDVRLGAIWAGRGLGGAGGLGGEGGLAGGGAVDGMVDDVVDGAMVGVLGFAATPGWKAETTSIWTLMERLRTRLKVVSRRGCCSWIFLSQGWVVPTLT